MDAVAIALWSLIVAVITLVVGVFASVILFRLGSRVDFRSRMRRADELRSEIHQLFVGRGGSIREVILLNVKRYNVKKRWIVIPSVALGLLGIGAIGVASHYDFIQGRTDALSAAGDLQTALADLDGVDSASVDYAPFGLPDGTTTVSVKFDANAPSSSWGTADQLVLDAAASEALKPSTTTADFSQVDGADSAAVAPLGLTPAELATEIDSWRSLNAAIGGGVSVRLGAYDPGTSAALREFSVSEPDDMLRIASSWTTDLADAPSTLPTMWIGPGVQSIGMPSMEQMRIATAIADVVPLSPLDGSGSSPSAAVLNDLRGPKVQFGQSSGGTDAADLSQLAEGVRVAFDAGAVDVAWSSPEHYANLAAGECGTYESFDGAEVATKQTANSDDEWFAAQLASVGFSLPSGVVVGQCEPIRA